MEKRALIAILLSLALWLIWFQLQPYQSPKDHQVNQEESGNKAETADKVKQGKDVAKKTPANEEISSRGSLKSKMSVISSGKTSEEIEIKTDKYKAVFSTKGAAIKSFKFLEKNIELIVNNNSFNAKGNFDFPLHFSEDEFINGSDLDQAIWRYRKDGSSRIVFSTSLNFGKEALNIEKAFSFIEGGYYFKVDYKLINSGRQVLALPNNYIIFSPGDFVGPSMDFTNSYNMLNNIYFLNSKFEKTTKGGGFFSGDPSIKKDGGMAQWAGVMSRYFLLLLMPDNFTGTGVIYDERNGTSFRTGIFVPVEKIEPGKEVKKSFKVYIGEKNKDKLAQVDKSLIDAADVSKLIEPIRDFLLWCLMKINLLFDNLGWSLVVFSILSKIIFLPLTQKSTESMKRMQELTPKINEIKEKYKDNAQKLNQEIMKLYKREKVNPASGCLPLLLQMPFFFALYSALINSVDLWQAPFILWIKDLSLPDTVLTISGFNLNVLPIVMTASTYIQQKMSSVGGASQQQKMMMFMPLIFIVIFWNMPSGLVLYWTMQNALQIAHQVYTNKKGKDKPQELK